MQMYEDVIKSEILQGLLQVDKTFMLTAYSYVYDSATRTIKVAFSATNAKNEEVSEVVKWH